MEIIDLRSDTVTKPSTQMLKAMMQAQVGDDVFGDDPTINALEALVADMLGKQAAVFAPSGTQSNLMGLMAHCQRGDEYIVGQQAHTYKWEGGGAAVLGSIQPQPLDFESDGTLSLIKVRENIKPIDVHHARTKLLCIENTQSGKALPMQYLADVKAFCKTTGLASHLDGARVFNAAVHHNVNVKEITKNFDSVSICLSKGLGAPVGSVLVGSHDLIRSARHWRKMLGGGMRQAGILAAAGIYALENNINRLADDHSNAALLAQGLSEIEEIKILGNHTNMVFLQVPDDKVSAFQKHLKSHGIITVEGPLAGSKMRLVTHLDVSEQDIKKVIVIAKEFFVKHNTTL